MPCLNLKNKKGPDIALFLCAYIVKFVDTFTNISPHLDMNEEKRYNYYLALHRPSRIYGSRTLAHFVRYESVKNRN